MPAKRAATPRNSAKISNSDGRVDALILSGRLVVLLAKLGSDSREIGMATGAPRGTIRNWRSFREGKHLHGVRS
jgi:hypothetical protein